jgi:hypothetical protein
MRTREDGEARRNREGAMKRQSLILICYGGFGAQV